MTTVGDIGFILYHLGCSEQTSVTEELMRDHLTSRHIDEREWRNLLDTGVKLGYWTGDNIQIRFTEKGIGAFYPRGSLVQTLPSGKNFWPSNLRYWFLRIFFRLVPPK